MIQACCFDLGNTLTNDTLITRNSVRTMAEWLLQNGYISDVQKFIETYQEVNQTTQRPFISHTFGEVDFFSSTFDRLGIDGISPEKALSIYREIVGRHTRVSPDLTDTFDYLHALGIRIALLSNERSARIDAFFRSTGLEPWFETVVVSERVGFEKPDLRIFREALSRLQIPAEEAGTVLMFGDNSIADGACTRIGMPFVLVTGYKNRDWYFEKGADNLPDHTIDLITRQNLDTLLHSISPDLF